MNGDSPSVMFSLLAAKQLPPAGLNNSAVCITSINHLDSYCLQVQMKVHLFSFVAVLSQAAALVPLVASLASSSPTPQAVPFKHNARTLLASTKRFSRELAKTSPWDPEIRQIALPAFATLALDPLMSMVDAAFVGHLGAAQLGQ
jgi:hypothetical protein